MMVLQKSLWLTSLHFTKTSFKAHTQALIRDKLPKEEGGLKSVVAEFQKKMDEKTWTILVSFPQSFYNPLSSAYQ